MASYLEMLKAASADTRLNSLKTISAFAEHGVCRVIDNLLVRIHFIVVMIGWTGLAPWEFECPFPGSLTSTFLAGDKQAVRAIAGMLAGGGLFVCKATVSV